MPASTTEEFEFSLAGRVRNLGFAPSPLNALFPLFEAIANALHAIEARWDRDASRDGRIVVKVLRGDGGDENPPVLGFVVEDNGVGLNSDNWKAFRTADTASKINRGGKGVGRLSWLKVFKNTSVASSFSQGSEVLYRTFDFALKESTSTPLHNHSISSGSDASKIGTRIHLEPYVDAYSVHCPRKIETIAAQIIGHFLRNFASYEVPSFILIDGHERINLLDFYSENVESEVEETLSVEIADGADPIVVDVYHILLKKGLRLHEGAKHWCLYVGDGRVVKDEKIDNQLGVGYVGENGDCVYIGLVAGDYLSSHVNQERTNFTFSDSDYRTLHASTVVAAKLHLAPYIDAVRAKQSETTLRVIRENPQFLAIANDVPAFVEEYLSLNAKSEEDIYLELARQRRRKQRETKREIRALSNTDGEDIDERVQKLASAINMDKKASLAEYVIKRKEILDLLDSSLAYADPQSRNYLREEIVHDLIIPIRSDGESLDYEDHNLWVLDDRLAFYSYLKSDKPFNTFLTDTESRREPDVAVVFDRSLAFDREGTDEPIVIVEFKRPGRTAYSHDDNPVTQVLEYVNIMRNGGAFKDRTGRIRKPIPLSTRFICFVIADFTPKLLEMVSISIAQNKSADGEGYFGFSPIHNAVVEVLPYNKLLHDARLRNEAFFAKLGLT
ncbi:ATP-binding protein [Novosphingobium sp. ZW T3_23]|uniref:ATP-binding protein n=1 Tax=Novosphingobium sp. ZW T3_23 TaxID=3378084 RepID=UPI003851BBA2